MIARGVRLLINGKEIASFRRFYGEETVASDEGLFAIWGSAGFLEIVAFQSSAARLLNARSGQTLEVKMGKG
jgi:S-adenosylmethionine hydrolase